MSGRGNGVASARTARHYDSQLWLERHAHTAALALAAPRPEDRVLDLATGTGGLLRLLAARPHPPREVLGVDASAAMLAQMRTLPTGWSVREGDARRLDLPDDSIDLVTCAYLIHLLAPDDRAAVLAQIARVLAPGGRAVLVSLARPRGLAGRALLAPAQAWLCRALGPGAGWCAHDPTGELTPAGLRLRAVRVSTRGYASLCVLAERLV